MSQQHLQINQDIWNNYFKKLFYSENIPLAKMTENIVKDMQPPISFRDEKLQFRTGKVYLHLPGNFMCSWHQVKLLSNKVLPENLQTLQKKSLIFSSYTIYT